MTNKPMLSVERELLEEMLAALKETHSLPAKFYGSTLGDRVRAILQSQNEQADPLAIGTLHRDCDERIVFESSGEIHIKDGMQVYAEPAAQHQGEPVAWVKCSPAWLKSGGDCATAPRICVGREGISHLHPAHSSAEQPAPVAVVMPERETYTKYLVGVIPHNANEVNAYKDGWNTCLEEVARLNGVKP